MLVDLVRGQGALTDEGDARPARASFGDHGDGHYVINVQVQDGKWYWTLKDGRSPVGPFAGERDAARNCLVSLAVYVELMDGVVFSIRYKGRVLVASQPPRSCTVAAIIAAQAHLD